MAALGNSIGNKWGKTSINEKKKKKKDVLLSGSQGAEYFEKISIKFNKPQFSLADLNPRSPESIYGVGEQR